MAMDEKQIKVKIPPGVTSGNYLTLRGEGNRGRRGGPAGDLIVLIEETPDKEFKRHGDDILYDLAISFAQAALGDKIDVPTLSGRARLTIPPGTQTGKILRMREKGIPSLGGRGRGDQLIRIVVWTPTRLSEEERRLFQEMRTVESQEPPPEGRGLWDRIWEPFS